MAITQEVGLQTHQEVAQYSESVQRVEHVVAQEHQPRRGTKFICKALAVMALSSSAVIAHNPERASVYAHLAKANVEHVMRDTLPFTDPVPTDSFDYLEYQYGVGNGLFTQHGKGNYAFIWPHSQAISAFRITSLVPEYSQEFQQKYHTSLNASHHYWSNGNSETLPGYDATIKVSITGETERFVDDNLWMGLIAIKEYEETGKTEWLQKAESVFAIAVEQWDEDRGGIYWQVQWPRVTDNTRALVSNAPAVQLGVKLYQLTGNEIYLDKSEKVFDWLKDHKDMDEGLFHDHVRIDNSYEYSKWSYVQGSVAGAMAALSQVDPERYSLAEAIDLAETSLDFLQQERLLSEPAFDAIYMKNLLWISTLQNDPDFTHRIQEQLALTISRLPAKPTNMLAAAGAMQLRALQLLPEDTYHELL